MSSPLDAIVIDYYKRVNKYWNEGLEPTVSLYLNPICNIDKKLPILKYLNNNVKRGKDLSIVSSYFNVIQSFEGTVNEGNTGIAGMYPVDNDHYTTEFYFDNVAINVIKLINEFLNNFDKDNYSFTMEIYVNIKVNGIIQPQACGGVYCGPSIQNKSDGVKTSASG